MRDTCRLGAGGVNARMPIALDNGQRSPRKLLGPSVRRSLYTLSAQAFHLASVLSSRPTKGTHPMLHW
jgi:hypothetical protein